jgi:predicted methyltransferase
MSARNGRVLLFVLVTFVLFVATPELYATDKTRLAPSRESIIHIVTQIQRADYEGDRPALKRLHDELTPIPEDNKLAARVLYWRGFALWRRAINGFNETPTPNDLDADLTQAVTDFKDSIARDPSFVEPKIGAGSSLGYLMFLSKKDPTRIQELFQQSSPLLKEAMAAAPDNPRLLWVLGPMRWSSPPERGGGQDKAFELYNKGLEAVRNQKRGVVDPLDPSWGEPELLMSLAWSNLNRTTPDLNAAEKDAQSALELVPYWHYVRDILMPQIRAAQAKAELPVAGSAYAQTQNQPNAKAAQDGPEAPSTQRKTSTPYSGDLSIFETPGRDERLQINRVMDMLGIEPGKNVADIGAGSGWFTVRAAHRVTVSGTVYAVDINPEAIHSIDQRSKKERLRNIKTILSKPDDPEVPAVSVDAVLLLKTYHEVAHPVVLLRNLHASLKPGAKIGIIDRNGNGENHGVSKEVVVREAAQAGYELRDSQDFVKADGMDYFLIFTAKPE